MVSNSGSLSLSKSVIKKTTWSHFNAFEVVDQFNKILGALFTQRVERENEKNNAFYSVIGIMGKHLS